MREGVPDAEAREDARADSSALGYETVNASCRNAPARPVSYRHHLQADASPIFTSDKGLSDPHQPDDRPRIRPTSPWADVLMPLTAEASASRLGAKSMAVS